MGAKLIFRKKGGGGGGGGGGGVKLYPCAY